MEAPVMVLDYFITEQKSPSRTKALVMFYTKVIVDSMPKNVYGSIFKYYRIYAVEA